MTLVAESAAAALFGGTARSLSGYIAEVLGPSVGDYDVEGVESDLRAAIDAALPPGVELAGESLVAVSQPAPGVEDVREYVGWIDVWTVALGHDMAGPGS